MASLLIHILNYLELSIQEVRPILEIMTIFYYCPVGRTRVLASFPNFCVRLSTKEVLYNLYACVQ